MRRILSLLAAGALALTVALPARAQVPPVPDPDDDKVTGQAYVRHDGGTDIGIEHCNDSATDPAADDDLTDIDIDSNDGGSRRQGNEPFSVVDPTNPDTIVAGWNDYCLTDLGQGWQGFAFSTDAGETWTDSIVPGYPSDTSVEGQASPLFGDHTDAGDPIAAFDNAGNLYVGGISFNRVGKTLGHVYVATYDTNAPDWTGGDESLYPVDYLRTVIVGRGSAAKNLLGVFQDKPMLEVDRTGGPTDGNVYVCWSRFTGNGQNKVYFSRSTDGGETFARPQAISRSDEVHSVQGCDIAIENDGDVYVTFRTFEDNAIFTTDGLGFARSTNGGLTFGKPELVTPIVQYFPFDTFTRNCGDGPLLCPSEFVFHRVPLEPRVTADQSGQLPGVYLTYNAVDPATIEATETSYSSAGAGASGEVGQSQIYVVSTLDDGDTWSDPIAVDPGAGTGHQFFPDIDALDGRLGVVWQDNRTDPCYDVQLPIGNTADATSCGTEIVTARFSFSFDGVTWGPSVQVSDVASQSQYEQFSNRDLPFFGDYNWISLARLDDGSVFAYMSWTDERDAVAGEDPREADVDGFDVLQCREDLGGGVFSADNCANAGGLDQNIYGNSAVFAP
jgi:hypothetical protein